MIVEVTRKDIRGGLRNIASDCPIALALNRKFNRDDILVYPYKNGWAFSCHRGRVHCLLPSSASRFAKRFDRGMKVQPFRFRISSHMGLAPAPASPSVETPHE
jgi:hypothetical protein